MIEYSNSKDIQLIWENQVPSDTWDTLRYTQN